MDKVFDHKKVEKKIYEMWENSGAFSPEKAAELRGEAGLEVKDDHFTVLMPPPNANAPLHCGHATYSIQDLVTRFKRMQGYKALYVPGTDHAGFETQVVYERELKEKGKTRFDFDRETLYEDIYKFVEKNSDIAIDQLKQLGMSSDWDRNTFTLDRFVIDTVYNTFEKMHKDGLIYRDLYLVNYSPNHGTTFSNLETVHRETVAPLFYVNYEIKSSGDFITVATTRPETIYADVAVAVNPEDERYSGIVGKTVINPLNGREMPVIKDSYVDVEFGTGALKITPGHDVNDFEIGRNHNLEMLSVIDLEGRMINTEEGVDGLNATEAREKVAKILGEKGALEKVDRKYIHNLVVDYKDEMPIEPMLLPNWFVRMESLAKKAVEAIEGDDVKFNLPVWKKESLRWLNNIRDWPISRQIVFGIRIPVWYEAGSKEIFVAFIDKEGNSREGKLGEFDLDEVKEGLQKVIAPVDAEYVISKDSPGKNYIQETDTFDTWFSSGQWPLVTLKYPDGRDFKKYFPTSFMDSMWDILFFWIVRMVVFSLYLAGRIPYEFVYIHGRIDDEKGQKMSKSRGNVIDPIEYVEKYGADALRMGILVGGNTAARSTSFSEDKVRGYRNFANKIWNMGRFIVNEVESFDGKIPAYSDSLRSELKGEDKNIMDGLDNLVKSTTDYLKKYRFMDAGNEIYHFMWNELASKYIEHVKSRNDKGTALSVLKHTYLTCLKLLHPFMPFVTEEVWGKVNPEGKTPIIIADWPKA